MPVPSKIYLNSNVITHQDYTSAIRNKICTESDEKASNGIHFQNLLVGICHSQEIDFEDLRGQEKPHLLLLSSPPLTFAHESGIHQDGILKFRETYEFITRESVGFAGSELVMGKHSGRAALLHKLESLNIPVEENEFNALFKKFKQLGDIQKEITDEDILALVAACKP